MLYNNIMNIFYLDEDVEKAAQYHMDRHVRKMIIEYAQLLSTAHRVVDGEMYYGQTSNGRKIKRWRLNDERENTLYKATHVNHPSNIWARACLENYNYLYKLFIAVSHEFEYRWGKKHATYVKLASILKAPPQNMKSVDYTIPIPQAMDEKYRLENSLDAYRNYYIYGKNHLAQWTKRNKPEWYLETV